MRAAEMVKSDPESTLSLLIRIHVVVVICAVLLYFLVLRKMQPRRFACGIDHIVWTCADLQKGIAYIEELTGVRAIVGGQHPGAGTHNALLALGDDCYLEIIAPDPAQPKPALPRIFGLDLSNRLDKLVAFAVHPIGVRIEALADGLPRGSALAPEPVIREMSRTKPDGETLRWRMSPVERGPGLFFWLIDWGATTSPARTSPPGCTLAGLQVIGPEAAAMEAVLAKRFGLQQLGASRDEAVVFVPRPEIPPEGETSQPGVLRAVLDTPKGRVVLG